MTGLPDEIERVALLGWRLYPASSRPGSKAALVSTEKDPAGRSPAEQATADLDQLEMWAKAYPGCNWRVVMKDSGIWALDIDAPGPDHEADGLAEMAKLVEIHGPLPTGPRSRSGGGGVVLFFSWFGERIRGQSGYPAPGLDPRPGDGRQSVTLPPSVHHTTRQHYRWLTPPWELNPPKAPDWLLKAVEPPPERPLPKRQLVSTTSRATRCLQRAVDTIITADKGRSNHALNVEAFKVGQHVGAGSLYETEAVEALFAAARHRGIKNRDAETVIACAFKAAYQKPLQPAR